MIEWTAEKIAQKTTEEVTSLRVNAAKQGNQKVVDLCDADLIRRKPVRVKPDRSEGADEDRSGQYVSEFHFICPSELDVTKNQDGSIWTGTWIVAEANAIAAEKYGSVVALHTSKANASYLQGVIKDWKKEARKPRYAEGQLAKTEFGISFLFEPTNNPLQWRGEATGEKGYAWAPIPSSNSNG